MSESLFSTGLAGRRVDPPLTAIDKFPVSNVPLVRHEIQRLLGSSSHLVCSAACGADLLGLQIAADCSIPFTIVLPFERERFRQTSVVDRGREWGGIFDRVFGMAERAGRVVQLNLTPGILAYKAVNEEIIRRLIRCQNAVVPRALVVWNGRSYGDDDLTEHFRQSALNKGISVHEILTV